MSFPTRILEALPTAIALWSLIGVAGTLLAWRSGDRLKTRRNAASIVLVWIVYAAVLLLTARLQPQRVIAPGSPECFSSVCYTITAVQSTGEFKGQGGGQLLQVSVRLTNSTMEPKQVPDLEAYLVDRTGQIWPQTEGLGGVPLTLRLPPGSSVLSQPVFRVQGSPPGLALVLTRGFRGANWLVPGDTDSPFHRRTILKLP